MAKDNAFYPKYYFFVTYPYWPDDYYQELPAPEAWCGWWPKWYWPTPNAYWPKYYWPACATIAVIYPNSIVSAEAFGTPTVTKPSAVERKERVKGFDHVPWIQY